jgi:hypothetical protein
LNDEWCEFTVLRNASIYSHEFNTEGYFDNLTVSGVDYSGTTGPNGVNVVAGESITWSTDGSIVGQGFTVCVTGAPTVSPTRSSPTTVPFAPLVHTFSSPVSCSFTRVTGHRYTQFCSDEFCSHFCSHEFCSLASHCCSHKFCSHTCIRFLGFKLVDGM